MPHTDSTLTLPPMKQSPNYHGTQNGRWYEREDMSGEIMSGGFCLISDRHGRFSTCAHFGRTD